MPKLIRHVVQAVLTIGGFCGAFAIFGALIGFAVTTSYWLTFGDWPGSYAIVGYGSLAAWAGLFAGAYQAAEDAGLFSKCKPVASKQPER